MNQEYIESGILELFVFGSLSEEESKQVQAMANEHEDIRAEILSIEKAIINLSYSVAPNLSPEVYHKIRQQLIEKHGEPLVAQLPRKGTSQYIGWAAALLLLFGLGYQYYQYNEATKQMESVTAERNKFEQLYADANTKNSKNEKVLALIRDKESKVVPLEGQTISPESYAKIYMNEGKNQVYVDIAGLPKAPQGKVYQVWALKLKPSLTPTSIGVLDDSRPEENKGIFAVDNSIGAEAFGITLEPAGGSVGPTLEQLYTLGEVKS